MIRLAIVGCGHWGPNHIRNFNALSESAVVVAADTDASRRARVQAMFAGVEFVADATSVFSRSDVDAVVISTPTATHYALVRAALLAGKHVLCEKPLCERTEQGQELAALATNSGLVLMVGHVFLFNPGIVKLKELIDGGDLGGLHYLSAIRTNLGPVRSDVNAAFDLASHDISIFNWLLGASPETVSALGGRFLQPNIDDVAFINMRYPGGVLASIEASWLNPLKTRRITIVGRAKMVTWDDMAPNPISIYDMGANTYAEPTDYGEFLRVVTWDNEIRIPRIQPAEPLRNQAQAFLDAIASGAPSRSGATFSLGVVSSLEAINESMQRGGTPVRPKEVAPHNPGDA
jgi:predicted dehydrogenase